MKNTTVVLSGALILGSLSTFAAQINEVTIPSPKPWDPRSAKIRIDTSKPASCFGDLAFTLGDEVDTEQQYQIACILSASKIPAAKNTDIVVPVYVYEETENLNQVGPLNPYHLPKYLPDSYLEQMAKEKELTLSIPTWPKWYVLKLAKQKTSYVIDPKNGRTDNSFDDMRKYIVNDRRSQREIRAYLERPREESKDDKKS